LALKILLVDASENRLVDMSRDRVSSGLDSEVVFELILLLLNHEFNLLFSNGRTLVATSWLHEVEIFRDSNIILALSFLLLHYMCS
jgi:hypothetical protein